MSIVSVSLQHVAAFASLAFLSPSPFQEAYRPTPRQSFDQVPLVSYSRPSPSGSIPTHRVPQQTTNAARIKPSHIVISLPVVATVSAGADALTLPSAFRKELLMLFTFAALAFEFGNSFAQIFGFAHLLQSGPALGLLFCLFPRPRYRQRPIMESPSPQSSKRNSDQRMRHEMMSQLPEASHADTSAMRRAYVRRFPTMASMNESSRLSVWRFTSPSFNLQVNSSMYRNRCLGLA